MAILCTSSADETSLILGAWLRLVVSDGAGYYILLLTYMSVILFPQAQHVNTVFLEF